MCRSNVPPCSYWLQNPLRMSLPIALPSSEENHRSTPPFALQVRDKSRTVPIAVFQPNWSNKYNQFSGMRKILMNKNYLSKGPKIRIFNDIKDPCTYYGEHTPNLGGYIRAHWLSCAIELWMWRIWRWRLLNHPVSCWPERRCLWRGSKYPPERGWILPGTQVTYQNHQQHQVGIFWELFLSKSDTYFWAHNQPCWVFAVLTSFLKPKIHRVKLGACLTNVAERSARAFLSGLPKCEHRELLLTPPHGCISVRPHFLACQRLSSATTWN